MQCKSLGIAAGWQRTTCEVMKKSANLQEVDLIDADLHGADLSRANLRRAILLRVA